MKKTILLLAFAISMNSAFAYNYNNDLTNNIIKEEQQITLCSDTQNWNSNCNSKEEVFSKKITYGSGGFSLYEKDKKLYDTDTTLEFIHNNKLLGYNAHKLKFYTLEFNNDKFEHKELSDNEIKELFPDIEIVKTSHFNSDNSITIYKPYFKTKTILLVNDTDNYYYKYQFENYPKQDELIRGIVELNKAQTLIFSHFGSRDKLFPILKIQVKNKFMQE